MNRTHAFALASLMLLGTPLAAADGVVAGSPPPGLHEDLPVDGATVLLGAPSRVVHVACSDKHDEGAGRFRLGDVDGVFAATGSWMDGCGSPPCDDFAKGSFYPNANGPRTGFFIREVHATTFEGGCTLRCEVGGQGEYAGTGYVDTTQPGVVKFHCLSSSPAPNRPSFSGELRNATVRASTPHLGQDVVEVGVTGRIPGVP